MSFGIAMVICTAIVSVCTMIAAIAVTGIIYGHKYVQEEHKRKEQEQKK